MTNLFRTFCPASSTVGGFPKGDFLDKKKLATYWANTSSNSLVGKLIREGDKDIKMDFQTLLDGGTLHTVLDEQIVYNQLSQKRDAVPSALKQIEEKNYAASLAAKGIPQDKTRCYGFAFQGKRVLIG